MIEYFFIGILLSITCSLISPIIVAKKLSNLSSSMAHATLGALAISTLILSNHEISSAHFLITVGVVAFFSLLIFHYAGEEDQDSSIAILFAGTMALGPVINGFTNSSLDYGAYLFGSILLTSLNDLYFIAPLLVALLFMLIFLKKYILYWVFDENYLAYQSKFASLITLLFLILASFIVVLASRISGIILMTSMLVVPGILSLKFRLSYFGTLFTSLIIGMLTFSLGFFTSYKLDSPIGASIALVQVLTYLIFYRRT